MVRVEAYISKLVFVQFKSSSVQCLNCRVNKNMSFTFQKLFPQLCARRLEIVHMLGIFRRLNFFPGVKTGTLNFSFLTFQAKYSISYPRGGQLREGCAVLCEYRRTANGWR